MPTLRLGLLAIALLLGRCADRAPEAEVARGECGDACAKGPAAALPPTEEHATLAPASARFEGRIMPGATACPPDPAPCRGHFQDGGPRRFPLAVHLTASASAPATGALRLGLQWEADERTRYELVAGASSLRLLVSALDVHPEAQPQLFVGLGRSTSVVDAYASTGQKFVSEGSSATASAAP